MEVKAEKKFQVNAKINEVWDVLTKPEKIVVCVPGAQLTETVDDDHFKGKVTVKIGPVIAKFTGEVEFSKRDSSTFELVMQGKGADIRGKGGATMNMNLSLNEIETGTEVLCMMTVSITGRIAQFGARMIEAVNNKLFEQFIKNFSNLLSESNDEASPTEISKDAEPVKAASLVGSILVSELKRKFGKKVELE
ncbi:MAG: SRPBCC family protein [SAR324 cluster bacterium]|nr:SRPBCC family protein [SAR324 cluster bacterium]MBL7035047.1 SRPBCC family protein [SAR324 cluster bacterium]